jgi:hypothetical protein
LREGNGVSTNQKIIEIENVTLEDVAAWAKSWKNKVYL